MVISRNILTTTALLIIICILAFSAGFFYKYQPERDQLELVIEQQVLDKNQNIFHSGIITKIEDGVVTIKTDATTIQFPLQGTEIEQLKPLSDLVELQKNMSVIVGGERYYSEKVINGVVFLKEKNQ